ncbi:hypothetical protein PsYK624_041740 [Phanerochaete sordida]|uniref:Rap1 Myb domain-containing protein n=1 Tax=Phanerochaete sordida TaxID=48140 RepID=A0A9P3LA77_9APHY|nr:hypothetical protein PsYK624_041740 [Phanerochaete sordida]
MQYLAIECPRVKGRMSVNTYNKLVDNLEDRWPWARRHPPEGWRERYRKRTNTFDPWIKQHQEKLGIDPTGKPRPDLWDEVEQRDNSQGRRKEAPKPPSKPRPSQAKPAQRPPKPSSSQNRPPPATPRRKPAPKRPRESESETEAEEPASPIRARAKGKARAVAQEEEEEESQRDGRGDELPVVREAEGEGEEDGMDTQEAVQLEPQVANRPASPPVQGVQLNVQEDGDVEMVDADEEIDELESTPAHQAQDEVKQEPAEAYVPSTQLVREFDELQERQAEHQVENASPQQSETQDAQETEDLLAGSDTQAANDMNDMEIAEQEVDELVSDEEQPGDPKAHASQPYPKQAPQASPRVVVQEPTPPTSDSMELPVNASVETSANASRPGSSTMHARPTTTVPRKRTRDDFFEDLESEAHTSTPPRPAKRRALHVLEEGRFGTTSLRELHKPGTAFRNGRRRSGVDELLPAAIAEEAAGDVRPEEPEWPPVWNKRKGKAVEPAVASPAKAGPSSRVRTPEPPAADAADPDSPNPFVESDFASSPIKPAARGAVRHESVEVTEIDSDDGEFPASPLKRPSTRAMPPPPPPPQAGPSRTPAQTPFRPQLIPKGKQGPVPSPTSSSSKGKARALPDPAPSSVRRRTLPDTLRSTSRNSSRSSTQGRKARSSLPAPRKASPLTEVGGMKLGADELQSLVEKGMEVTLRDLSARTGFALDVVRNACRRMNSFALAEKWLTRMSSVVAEHADEVTREVMSEAGGSMPDDDEEEGDERDDADEDDAPADGPDGSGGESEVYHPPEDTRAWELLEKSRVEEEEAEAQESSRSVASSPQPQSNRWNRVLRSRGEKRR